MGEHKAYSLASDGNIVARAATPEEIEAATAAASAKLDKDAAGYAMRSCWVCNPAHSHFLENLNDEFLFVCAWGCGHWFYQGIDLSGDEESDPPDSAAGRDD